MNHGQQTKADHADRQYSFLKFIEADPYAGFQYSQLLEAHDRHDDEGGCQEYWEK
jgi:hypothetical protein